MDDVFILPEPMEVLLWLISIVLVLVLDLAMFYLSVAKIQQVKINLNNRKYLCFGG